jgi:type VI secretion system secreted protein Hcp
MAANYFLRFDPKIEGESQQADHEGDLEILSFSWGVSQAGGFAYGSGGTSAKANVQDLSVSFRMCKSSPKLMQSCASGVHFDSATLFCLRATGDGHQEKYLELTMTDVVVSSYQTGGSGDDMPIESMSLNFVKVKEEYFQEDDTGNVTSAGEGIWNQATATTE